MLLRDLHISQWPEYEFWTLQDVNGVGQDFKPAEDLALIPGVSLARPARLARSARRATTRSPRR